MVCLYGMQFNDVAQWYIQKTFLVIFFADVVYFDKVLVETYMYVYIQLIPIQFQQLLSGEHIIKLNWIEVTIIEHINAIFQQYVT